MNNSYLIQRLLKPYENVENRKIQNAFSFGGGLKNGGLTDQTLNLIKDIFRFDCMGYAEFEWGAVPEALTKIFEGARDYISFSTSVKWEHSDYFNKEAVAKGKSTIYVICHKDWKPEVVKRVKKYAKGLNTGQYRTKTSVGLNESLAGKQDHLAFESLGWLELNNGYFFFKDKEMFEKTCELFDIKIEV